MSTSVVLGPIHDKLEQIKSLTKSYDPSLPFFLNTLTSLNVTDGYWLRVSENINLEIEGEVPAGVTIPVKAGWNLVGYPRGTGGAVSEELASLGNTLVQIKNLTKSNDPSLPFFLNTLTTMTPGQGYWLRVSENGTWRLGEAAQGSSGRDIVKMTLEEEHPRWGPVVVYPELSATVLAEVTVGDTPVGRETLVGAFVGEELRAKQTVVLANGRSYLTMNVNLGGTEKVRYRIWDEVKGIEYPVSKVMQLDRGGVYGKRQLVKLDGRVSTGTPVWIIGYTRSPFSLRFETDPNRTYKVAASSDLKAWETVEQFKSTNRSHQFSDPREERFPQQYYRVRVE